MITERTCPTGKRVYLTWAHAANDARQMRRNKRNAGSRELPYSCHLCSGFHAGQHVKNPRKMKEM